jgi:tryptophan synthase alpha subunit
MRKLFFPYLLANYPDPDRFSEILDLAIAYADTIEIGIPFTDPVADGPVIANASSKVLQHGFSIDSVFQLLEKKKSKVPIALMSYANPILAYGKKEFMKASKQSGIRHLILPDVPFEESDEWRAAAKEFGLSWISFISLLTGEERLKRIAQTAEGFIYLLALKGITGAAIHSPEQVCRQAKLIRKYTKVPIALGFGIKSRKDAEPFVEDIDAMIVGSRIIELIHSNNIEDLERLFMQFRGVGC